MAFLVSHPDVVGNSIQLTSSLHNCVENHGQSALSMVT